MKSKQAAPSTVQISEGSGVDESLLKDLSNRLTNLQDDYEKFKQQILQFMKDLQDQLNAKADLETVANLESKWSVSWIREFAGEDE